MPVRLRNTNSVVDPGNPIGPEFVEVPFENRVTEVGGAAFHWAPNRVRSFADDGIADLHAAGIANDGIGEDNFPGEPRS